MRFAAQAKHRGRRPVWHAQPTGDTVTLIAPVPPTAGNEAGEGPPSVSTQGCVSCASDTELEPTISRALRWEPVGLGWNWTRTLPAPVPPPDTMVAQARLGLNCGDHVVVHPLGCGVTPIVNVFRRSLRRAGEQVLSAGCRWNARLGQYKRGRTDRNSRTATGSGWIGIRRPGEGATSIATSRYFQPWLGWINRWHPTQLTTNGNPGHRNRAGATFLRDCARIAQDE